MAFVPLEWADNDPTRTVSAARMTQLQSGILEALAAATSAAETVFSEEPKSPGENVDAADVYLAATWSTDLPFEVRLPRTDVRDGQEVRLVSRGLGTGRVLASATNLYPYGSGRAGFSGSIWTGRTSTISAEVGGGVDGTDAIVATSTGASSAGGFGTQNGTTSPALLLSAMGLTAGDVVSLRYHLTVPAGATGRAQVRWYRGTSLVSEASQTATTGDGYRTIAGLTVPVGADRMAIVTYTTSTTAGQVSKLSAITMDYGSTAPTAYVDGAQAGGEWWGAPDASPSSLGRVLGDGIIRPEGESIARHLGSGRWLVSALGPTPDVMRAGDVLTVDRDINQQGITSPSAAWITTSVAALTAQRALLARFVPSRAMMIRSIAFRVTTASGTDDPVDVGIYDATGARLVSSGSTTGRLNSTGTKTVNVTATILQAGVTYYAAFCADSTAAVQRATVFADGYGTALPALESGYVNTSFPLPSSVSTLTSSDAAPVLILREFT